MVVATLSVGSASNLPIKTITFNDFESYKPKLSSSGLFFADYAYGGGTEIKDSGKREKRYEFVFTLKNDSGYPDSGDCAFEKLLDFFDLCYFFHPVYKYQRKLSYTKPDASGDTSINGVLTMLDTKVVAGDNDIYVTGAFGIAPDDIAEQVP